MPGDRAGPHSTIATHGALCIPQLGQDETQNRDKRGALKGATAAVKACARSRTAKTLH